MKELMILLALVNFMFGCTNVGTKSSSTGDCKLENTEWMKVTNGYDSEVVMDLANKFEAAASADIERLKGMPVDGNGNANGSFTSDFIKVVNSNSNQSVEVSQEFFENYRAKRDALCNILFLLDELHFTEMQKNQLIQSYADINASFAAINTSEEKKSQN